MTIFSTALTIVVSSFLRKFPNRNPKFILQPAFRSSSFQFLKPQAPFSYTMSQNGALSSAAKTGSSGGYDKHRVNHFSLSSSSALKIQRGDITEWSIDGTSDAIVNAANELMLGGGGVDGAIHRAAGPQLRAACYDVPVVSPGTRCPTGEARITPGFKLPVSHVIHTVGPIYDAHDHPETYLTSAYRNSLRVAKENNIQYIAFPAISCGVFGYPYGEAATIAISAIKEFASDFKEVHFVLFADDIYNVWLDKANALL